MRSVTAKTRFSKTELTEILLDYNLGAYKGSEPLGEGTVQTNYLLETEKGKVVFKYYENRSKESVLFESNLIEYLKGHNYPCPAQIRNRNRRFVGIYKEKPFVIFQFVEGQHLKNPNENQKRQLIRRAAELQNLTRNYRPFYREYRWNYSVELCRKLARKEAEKINTANSKEKLRWFENELSKLNLPRSLPKGICHCDFHFSNALFKNGRLSALIDFDDANYTFLMFDLAWLINPFMPSFS